MGTIVVTEFISLDGVVEAPGGENFRYPNWSFEVDRGPDGERYKEVESIEASAQLLGRTTYEGFAEAWPKYEGELADKINSMPKYVVSRTLTDPTWTNTLMSFPVILGHGRTLWASTPDKTAWKLTEATTYGDGVLVTAYQRTR